MPEDHNEATVDEVAWRKGHRYLTLIGDHRRRCVVWGTEGKGQAAADEFFAELDRDTRRDADHGREAEAAEIEVKAPAEADVDVQVGERAGQLRAVSMDMTGGYAKSVRRHAPQAVICIDNYHVVQLATKALDEVRREHWNELRQAGDPDAEVCFDPFHVVQLAGRAVDNVRRAEWNAHGKSTTPGGRWVKHARWSLPRTGQHHRPRTDQLLRWAALPDHRSQRPRGLRRA